MLVRRINNSCSAEVDGLFRQLARYWYAYRYASRLIRDLNVERRASRIECDLQDVVHSCNCLDFRRESESGTDCCYDALTPSFTNT